MVLEKKKKEKREGTFYVTPAVGKTLL